MDYSTFSKSSLKNVKFGAGNPVVALLLNVSAWTCLLSAAARLSHEILIIGASPRTTRFNLFVYLKRVEIHSPTPDKTMTQTVASINSCNTAFHSKARFKTAIRLAYTDLCWANGRQPFGEVPGNDPNFHATVETIAQHLFDEMFEMLDECVFENC